MNVRDKLNVLARIARAFDRRGISWAAGASLMLYLRGIALDFRDIDLLTAESDFPAARDLLASMGAPEPVAPGAGSDAEHSFKCGIDGAAVCLTANLAAPGNGEHRLSPEADGMPDRADVLGQAIPLQSVALCREYCQRTGRDEELRMIDAWQRARCEPLRSWAMELQSIAQCGLTYARDPYDIERYERLRAISAEMLAHQTGLPAGEVRSLFCNETGYQTPKIDTRAAIFREGKILLVRERDGRWALPGGWCDVLESVGSNAVKEVREEAGLDVLPERLIAVQDRNRHNLPVYAYGVCKVFLLCLELGGEFAENIETTGFDTFGLDALPPLAEAKCNREQIEMCFRAHADANWKVQFD